MRFFYYFFRTLYDIGFERLLGRILYEIKKIFLKILPKKIIQFLFNIDKETPKYNKTFTFLKKVKISKKENFVNPGKISFSFLNQKEILCFPIKWNSNKYNQLWRFNLHYFEWYRQFLEIKLKTDKWPYDPRFLNILINDWIDNNKLGFGDGWHSYTISLRVRSWILVFRICPELLNQKIIDSLWEQISWLYSNKEDYIGGNHWLENLITLLIGSLQFEGKKSKAIFEFSYKQLEKELACQILKDGGHFERSASYHLLLLERLIELGLILENTNGLRPYWLISSIRKMTNWAYLVRLRNGKFPIFNDNLDMMFNIDSIINYGISYLNKKNISEKGIKNILTNIYSDTSYQNNFQLRESDKNKYITKLNDTGWIIARDNKGLELIFKIGDSCPKYLPAHTHSDLLSFDLFKDGLPLIVETGTSLYGNSEERYYERSGAAHNIFQLAPFKGYKKKQINWIEPIEVWGNFRAARKAKVLEKSSGYNKKNKTIWLQGSNDAHSRYGTQHIRKIFLKISSENKTQLRIIDEVTCFRKMYWRQFWHLGPGQSEHFLADMIFKLRNHFEFEEKWISTWYSIGFGKRVKRKTLCLSGVIEKGIHKFENKLFF